MHESDREIIITGGVRLLRLPLNTACSRRQQDFLWRVCKKATPTHLNKQPDPSLKTITFSSTSIEPASPEKTLWQPPGLIRLRLVSPSVPNVETFTVKPETC